VNNVEDTRSPDIDKIIHEPARLKIMAQLYVIESADFIHPRARAIEDNGTAIRN
jgi:predicted methyltransferase